MTDTSATSSATITQITAGVRADVAHDRMSDTAETMRAALPTTSAVDATPWRYVAHAAATSSSAAKSQKKAAARHRLPRVRDPSTDAIDSRV